jgi:hypothetical protein
MIAAHLGQIADQGAASGAINGTLRIFPIRRAKKPQATHVLGIQEQNPT